MSARVTRRVALKLLKRIALAASGGGAIWWFFFRRPNKRKELEPSAHSTSKKKNVGLNKEFVDQIKALLPVLFPKFWSRTTALMAAHTTCLIGRTLASIYLASMDGKIVKALITGNGRRFLSLLSIWLLSAVPIAFVNAAIKFLKNQLAQSFRDRLTRKAHEEYLTGLTYYQLEQLDGRLQNPGIDGGANVLCVFCPH